MFSTTRTWMALVLAAALAAACGAGDSDREDERGKSADDTGAGDDSKLDGHGFYMSNTTIEAFPDRVAANGNEGFDAALVPLTFFVELHAFKDDDYRVGRQPITTATVRIGLSDAAGDADALKDDDFRWVTLTHSSSGRYKGEGVGLARVYRADIRGPVVGVYQPSLVGFPEMRVLKPLQDAIHPVQTDLSVKLSENADFYAGDSLSDYGSKLEFDGALQKGRMDDQGQREVPAALLTAGNHEVSLSFWKFANDPDANNYPSRLMALQYTRSVTIKAE